MEKFPLPTLNIIVSYYLDITTDKKQIINTCMRIVKIRAMLYKDNRFHVLSECIRLYFINTLKKMISNNNQDTIKYILNKKIDNYPFVVDFENDKKCIIYDHNKPKGKLLIYFLSLFYNYICQRNVLHTYTTTLKCCSAGKLHNFVTEDNK